MQTVSLNFIPGKHACRLAGMLDVCLRQTFQAGFQDFLFAFVWPLDKDAPVRGNILANPLGSHNGVCCSSFKAEAAFYIYDNDFSFIHSLPYGPS